MTDWLFQVTVTTVVSISVRIRDRDGPDRLDLWISDLLLG